MRIRGKAICFVMSLIVAVTFMPLTGQTIFAGEGVSPEAVQQETTFNSGGVVSGFRVAKYSFNRVTIGWSAYKGATGYQVYRATKKKRKI